MAQIGPQHVNGVNAVLPSKFPSLRPPYIHWPMCLNYTVTLGTKCVQLCQKREEIAAL